MTRDSKGSAREGRTATSRVAVGAALAVPLAAVLAVLTAPAGPAERGTHAAAPCGEPERPDPAVLLDAAPGDGARAAASGGGARGAAACGPSRSAQRADPAARRAGGDVGTPADEARPLLRLRVVDARTGEPVPRFQVAVRGAGSSSLATSDAAGAIELHREPGALVVCATGLPDRVQRIQHRGAGAAVAVPVDVGPTYHLDLGGWEPRGGMLCATFLPPPHPAQRALARAIELGADVGRDVELRAHEPSYRALVARVQPRVQSNGPHGGRWWARFERALPDAARPARQPAGYELLLYTDRDRVGRAFVPSLDGVCPDVALVASAPVGAIAGRLTVAGPRPWVTLRDRATGAVRETAADWDGEFDFVALAPGDYVLRAESLTAGVATQLVTVRPGEAVELELALPRDPRAPFAAGVVRCAPPAATGDVVVELASLADPRTCFRCTPRIAPRSSSGGGDGAGEADGEELEGAFAFRGVPPGAYELRVRSSDGRPWRPGAVVLEEPRDDLVVTREDRAPGALLVLEARDPETGAALALDGVVWVDGVARPIRTAGVASVPRSTRGGWAVVARGCAPRTGRWEVRADEDVVRVDAGLARGSGRLALATTPWGDAVAGAEVCLDGAAAGRTGPGGVVAVAERGALTASRPGFAALPASSGPAGWAGGLLIALLLVPD